MRRSSRTMPALTSPFSNAELKRAGKPPIATERVVDTLVLARRKHSGGLTFDDLCSRYGVDRSRRSYPRSEHDSSDNDRCRSRRGVPRRIDFLRAAS
jgi:DNA polymerase III epsilon subunit-like protein